MNWLRQEEQENIYFSIILQANSIEEMQKEGKM